MGVAYNGNYTSVSQIKGPSGVTINASGINVTGVITATSFVKLTGASNEFLKADGSVDSTSYTTKGIAIAMSMIFK